MLMATLVSLVFQGRKREQEQREKAKNAPLEIVRTSQPTPTRALSPPDLVFIEPAGDKPAGVQNRGLVGYKHVMLRIVYLDGGGRVLATHDQVLGIEVPPRQTVPVGSLDAADVPGGWVRRTFRILYAELAPR